MFFLLVTFFLLAECGLKRENFKIVKSFSPILPDPDLIKDVNKKYGTDIQISSGVVSGVIKDPRKIGKDIGTSFAFLENNPVGRIWDLFNFQGDDEILVLVGTIQNEVPQVTPFGLQPPIGDGNLVTLDGITVTTHTAAIGLVAGGTGKFENPEGRAELIGTINMNMTHLSENCFWTIDWGKI